MSHRLPLALLLVVLTACGSGSGGGIDWGLPACGDTGYDPSQYQLAAEFNGSECAFVFFVAKSGTDVCVCPEPGPMTYCGGQTPAFDGKCPKP